MSIYTTLLLVVLLNVVCSRDFYVGMFAKNDILIAQDRLYRERLPWRYAIAKYGRVFKCPITYFRVADRLGVGGGPKVQIIRGGLRKKFIVARITSPYNLPISVNIYAGCTNTMKSTPWSPKKVSPAVTDATTAAGAAVTGGGGTQGGGNSEPAGSGGTAPGGTQAGGKATGGGGDTTVPGGASTTPAAETPAK